MSDIAKEVIEAIQGRLQSLNYYTGRVDGVAGSLTSNAIILFKREHGLRARDFVGPITLTTLFSENAKRHKVLQVQHNDLPWVIEARKLIGIREQSGPSNNPTIMDWADNLDQWYPGDDVPWCGLFIAHCMSVGAPSDPQDFNRLGAREWGKYGKAVEPMYGCVATFWRGSRDGWKGHVGIIIGEDDTAYHIIGGNQSDSVSVTRISKSRLLETRWPDTMPVTDDLPPLASVVDGSLSTDEA